MTIVLIVRLTDSSCDEIQCEVMRRSPPPDNYYRSCIVVACRTRPRVTGESTVIHPNGWGDGRAYCPQFDQLFQLCCVGAATNKTMDRDVTCTIQLVAKDSANTADSLLLCRQRRTAPTQQTVYYCVGSEGQRQHSRQVTTA